MENRLIKNKVEKYLSPEDEKESISVNEVKERILEKLEEKVGIVKDIKRMLDETKSEEDPQVVRDRFRQYGEKIFAQYPKAHETLKEINDMRKKFDALEEKLYGKSDSDDYEEPEESNALIEESDEIAEKVRAYLKDSEDVNFLDAVQNGLATIVKKFSFVKELENNRERIIQALERELFSKEDEDGGQEIDRDKIKDIVIDPFTITVIFEKNYFEGIHKEQENILGFHQRGTPFNIVRASREEKDLLYTIEHEKIHNLLEGFLPLFAYPSRTLRTLLDAPMRMKKAGALSVLIENAEKRKKEIIPTLFAQELVDRLHEEMLADIDEVDALSLKPFYDWDNMLPKEDRRFVGFHTAQQEIVRMTQLLQKASKEEENKEIRESCSLLKKGINTSFDKAASNIRKFTFVSHQIGNELEVQAMLTLLSPRKFHHINTYLRDKYKDIYEGNAGVYKVLVDRDFSFPTLENIEKIKGQLTEENIELLRKRIVSVEDFADFIDYSGLRGSSLERIRSYLNLYHSLNTRLNIGKDALDSFEYNAMWNFFYYFLEDDLGDNFQRLPQLFHELNEKEKRAFIDALESYAEDFIQEDLGKVYETKVTRTFIKSLPLWQILADLELDTIVQKGLDKYDKRITRVRDD